MRRDTVTVSEMCTAEPKLRTMWCNADPSFLAAAAGGIWGNCE
jgi:hypothetical protein